MVIHEEFYCTDLASKYLNRCYYNMSVTNSPLFSQEVQDASLHEVQMPVHEAGVEVHQGVSVGDRQHISNMTLDYTSLHTPA